MTFPSDSFNPFNYKPYKNKLEYSKMNKDYPQQNLITRKITIALDTLEPIPGRAGFFRATICDLPISLTDANISQTVGMHQESKACTTEGQKYDDGKPPISFISRYAIEQEAMVMAFGAKKYAAHNWRKGMPWTKIINGILRHVHAIADGEDRDEETGLSHAAHARCGLAFLLEYMRDRKDLDDRYVSPMKQGKKEALGAYREVDVDRKAR